MSRLHLGDISELAYRVGALEDEQDFITERQNRAIAKHRQQDGRLDRLEDEHDIDHPEYAEDEYGEVRPMRHRKHWEGRGRYRYDHGLCCGGYHWRKRPRRWYDW